MASLDTEKARYIQNRDGIAVSESHFISKEGAKLYGYPTSRYNHGDGGHVDVVRHEGQYYLTQTTGTGKPCRGPIPYGKSGRN